MISTLSCLATAIYFEARGEPTLGQIAVGQVIMTRVYDPRYPDNVCDVVKEGYYYSWSPETPIPDMCQFSFWCDGQPETINDPMHISGQKKWHGTLTFLNIVDLTEGSTYYHAHYVKPYGVKVYTNSSYQRSHILQKGDGASV